MICAPWRSIRSSAAGSMSALDGRLRAAVCASMAPETLELQLKASPVLADALEEASDGLATAEVAAVGKVLGHAPVDVVVEHPEERGYVAATERAVQSVDGFRG